jgi:hemoglobin
LQGIEPEHFRRWLHLFEDTARELFSTTIAEEIITVARRIAASLQLGFFGEVLVA